MIMRFLRCLEAFAILYFVYAAYYLVPLLNYYTETVDECQAACSPFQSNVGYNNVCYCALTHYSPELRNIEIIKLKDRPFPTGPGEPWP